MPDPILTAANWLWDKFAKDLANKAANELAKRWKEFQWPKAETRYRERLYEQYGYTRLLGNPKKIEIENLFTDVYVLDKPTAYKRFDLNKLQNRPLKRNDLKIEVKRRPALRLAVEESRLFILGKPGAGKTTFLKYLTLQACIGKISKTPIFVSLKEWADSGLELMSFLHQLFEICDFPDAGMFIDHLLKDGDALVLFDGLDEVNVEGEQRTKLIRMLTQFAQRYPRAQICLTCRIAATEYSFSTFTYIEIADFDECQIDLFVKKWYQDESQKLASFLEEFKKPEHEGLRELAQTPLLLTLLCLGFDETLTFSDRRVDLYRDALDALLKKWDSSRGIRRDDIYRKLSTGRKEQMLARIAAQNFENNIYFVRQSDLIGQITRYLQTLPDVDLTEDTDGEIVLKAIETQHGILTERAHGIYSFSHLTFQEYYTARYIVDNAESGSIKALVNHHMADIRWREVFLLTTSMLDNADTFFEYCLESISKWIEKDSFPANWLKWANAIAIQSKHRSVTVRSILLMTRIMLACDSAYTRIVESKRAMSLSVMQSRNLERNHARNLEHAQDRSNKLNQALDSAIRLARKLNRDGGININLICYDDNVDGKSSLPERINMGWLFWTNYHKNNRREALDIMNTLGLETIIKNLEPKQVLSDSEIRVLIKYLEINHLLLDCLKLAAVTNRQGIEDRLLLPLAQV